MIVNLCSVEEEISECAEKYAVGDCVHVRLSYTEHLVGKVTAKTNRFLQITKYPNGRVPKTFLDGGIVGVAYKAGPCSLERLEILLLSR